MTSSMTPDSPDKRDIRHLPLSVCPFVSTWELICCCSVVQSCLTRRPHGLQHARLPCPSLTPGVCLNSCPLNWWQSFSCVWLLTTPRTAAYQAPPSMGLSDESIRNLELDLYYLRNTSMAIFSFFAFSLGKNLWQEQFPSDCQAPGVCLRGVTPVIQPRRTWLWQGLPTNQLDPDDNQGAVLSFYPWKTQAQAGTLSLLDGAAPGLSLRWPGKPGLSCSSSASPFHPHSSSTQWRINHCSSQ